MEENDELKKKYIDSLSELEKEALSIAKKELESSFCLEKSIGFLEFKKFLNNNKK